MTISPASATPPPPAVLAANTPSPTHARATQPMKIRRQRPYRLNDFCSPLMTRRFLRPNNTESNISPEPIVWLRDVHLHVGAAAGQVNILRGLDLTIAAGETVAVIGPSGSGKSTMMMIAGGLERQTSGSVRVAGHDLSQMSEDQLALFRRDRVGIVFQSFHLIPAMTALENVAVPLELAGRDDAFAAAERGLDAVGLSHRLDHYRSLIVSARCFSGAPGMVQSACSDYFPRRISGRNVPGLAFQHWP